MDVVSLNKLTKYESEIRYRSSGGLGAVKRAMLEHLCQDLD